MRFKGSELELTAPVNQCSCRVIYGDTDAGGVVYYGNYFRFFEKGRSEFLRTFLDTTYRELEERGIVLPVSESYCRYKVPARYDDLLTVSTSLAEYNRASLRFHYLISRSEDDRLVAKGFTVHAAIEGKTGRLRRLPQELLSSFDRLGSSARS